MSNMVVMLGQMNIWGRGEQVNGKELSVYLLHLGCIETADGILEFGTVLPFEYT